ncbi:MAG: hypothetical protein FJW38_29295 [Acidobacteria bacterium]|nr:hypothetical protein [Acidobacteriota bacterium]
MRTTRPKSVLDRSADSDLWIRTLSQIPTRTGQLVYLATLRNPISGRYEHHGLSLVFGDEDAEKAIRQSHRRVFLEWLSDGLAEKVDDVDSYLSGTGENVATVIAHWLRTAAWNTFLPATLAPAEKSLYGSDMRNVLTILAGRIGGATMGQNA